MESIQKHQEQLRLAILEKFGSAGKAAPKTIEFTTDEFEKATVAENLQVYEQSNLENFLSDVKTFGDNAEIEKAKKDLSKLTKVKVTDKNGHSVYRWVARGEASKPEKPNKTDTVKNVSKKKDGKYYSKVRGGDSNVEGSLGFYNDTGFKYLTSEQKQMVDTRPEK